MIAIGFGLGAIVHLAALVIPAFGVAVGVVAPAWRNALFTFIDATLGWAMLRRPPILMVALPLFLAQQVSKKGVNAWRLAGEGQIDWLSLLVLGFLLYAVVAVARDVSLRSHLRPSRSADRAE